MCATVFSCWGEKTAKYVYNLVICLFNPELSSCQPYPVSKIKLCAFSLVSQNVRKEEAATVQNLLHCLSLGPQFPG